MSVGNPEDRFSQKEAHMYPWLIICILIQHDPDGDAACSPGGDTGNYIMYAYAISANQDNNDDFSSCSIGSIKPVLEVKARGSNGCFVGKIHNSSVDKRYSQEPNVFPQHRNFNRHQCVFMLTRKFSVLQLAKTILCLKCHLKVQWIRKYSIYFH